jgi:hypothetical protein
VRGGASKPRAITPADTSPLNNWLLVHSPCLRKIECFCVLIAVSEDENFLAMAVIDMSSSI